jgi:hypothetical protein
LLAEPTVWDLVSADELVDGVSADAQKARCLLDIEYSVVDRGGLIVVRRADR